jgi:hypothetical protein
MEAIAKVYEVKFVLNIAKLGESNPLWRNVSCLSAAVLLQYCINTFLSPLPIVLGRLLIHLSFVFFFFQGSMYFQDQNIPW